RYATRHTWLRDSSTHSPSDQLPAIDAPLLAPVTHKIIHRCRSISPLIPTRERTPRPPTTTHSAFTNRHFRYPLRPQQRFHLRPLPHRHGAFRAITGCTTTTGAGRASNADSHNGFPDARRLYASADSHNGFPPAADDNAR